MAGFAQILLHLAYRESHLTVMYILNNEATDSLNRLLHLHATGNEQDWDIELAAPARIGEFLTFFKRNGSLDKAQKQALMALIIASCEELLQMGDILGPETWADISFILQSDVFYHNLIEYWSLSSEKGDEDLFAMTSLMRSIC